MTKIGKVYAVDSVSAIITRTSPPWLTVHVQGRTTSTGWSNGQLSAYIYVTPPGDGIQEYDFIADRPPGGSITLPVLSPISAHAEIENIDVDNYWGPGQSLKGIRVHASSNAKIVEIHSRATAAEMITAMSPAAVASFVAEENSGEVPGFAEEIRPLFRDRDASIMEAIAGFNLHKYEDVKANAEAILERLNLNMPCDGLWPQSDIDKFTAWKEGGTPA